MQSSGVKDLDARADAVVMVAGQGQGRQGGELFSTSQGNRGIIALRKKRKTDLFHNYFLRKVNLGEKVIMI